jgi:mono/diheme cytochrome c family protein
MKAANAVGEAAPASRRTLSDTQDVLLVMRSPPESWPRRPRASAPSAHAEPVCVLAVCGDGRVLAFDDHADLGVGVALARIVAEALDVPLARVAVVPVQASARTRDPVADATLRTAAAQARQYLLARAAQVLGADPARLAVRDGRIAPRDDDAADGIGYGELIRGRRIALMLAADALPLAQDAAWRDASPPPEMFAEPERKAAWNAAWRAGPADAEPMKPLAVPADARLPVDGDARGTTRRAVTDPASQAYPVLTFREVPVIEMMTGLRDRVPASRVVERFRRLPFTRGARRAALGHASAPAALARRRTRGRFGWLGAFAASAAGAAGAVGAAGALGLAGAFALAPRPLAPIAPPPAAAFAPELIARGRQLAALGDCAVCHTARNGIPNAGGRPLDTPFGTIYATNITPDVETGIGAWSFEAFARAMREGIARDGHRLYPAFPYTSFRHVSDADLEALYAYLMTQTPVRARVPATRLAFPFNLRPLLAAWNGAFVPRATFAPDPARSAQWNRGAYLVNGLGHCGACHTPRNRFGAERGGTAFLGGGFAEGWEAPALTRLSNAPVPWTEDELFSYLRYGEAPLHGVAAGPMAPVVGELAALPDSDIRAIAHYVASLSPASPNADPQALAREYVAAAAPAPIAPGPGARLFDGACAACHHVGGGPLLFGAQPPLALNTNLHGDTPDNLIRVILDGIDTPARPELGTMPAYRDSFDDAQIADLLRYLRAQYAGGKPPWTHLEATVARIRAAPRAH